MRLDGKVALITGGARGIGATAARRFVAEGARVTIGDVREQEGRALAAELGEAALFVPLDVTDLGQWQAAVAATEERFGKLDVLVNNAGVVSIGSIADTDPEEYLRVIRVNQLGVWLGMKAVVGAMERAGGGSIINSSSVEGLGGSPFQSAYVASKFAVRGMTKTAALEFAPLGIRVNSIHPGAIETPMLTEVVAGVDLEDLRGFLTRSIPMGRLGRPEEVAALMVFLASDESSYCTGAEFVIDGGLTSTSGFGHGG